MALSQGALAMDVALSSRSRLERSVNGVVVFSAYFITHEEFSADRLATTPLLWAHSQKDPKTPYSLARYGYDEQLIKILHLAHSQFLVFENHGHGHVFDRESVRLVMLFVRRGLPIDVSQM